MADQRLHNRLDSEEKCIVNLRGSYYNATAKNISLGGVLVHFFNSQPDLHIGDSCIISMNGESLVKYPSVVVRVAASEVALRFIDMDIPNAVEH